MLSNDAGPCKLTSMVITVVWQSPSNIGPYGLGSIEGVLKNGLHQVNNHSLKKVFKYQIDNKSIYTKSNTDWLIDLLIDWLLFKVISAILHLLQNCTLKSLFTLCRHKWNEIIIMFQTKPPLTTSPSFTVLPSKLVMMEHFMTLLTLSSVRSPCLRYVRGQPEV